LGREWDRVGERVEQGWGESGAGLGREWSRVGERVVFGVIIDTALNIKFSNIFAT
jgi:hypothetical protein